MPIFGHTSPNSGPKPPIVLTHIIRMYFTECASQKTQNTKIQYYALKIKRLHKTSLRFHDVIMMEKKKKKKKEKLSNKVTVTE